MELRQRIEQKLGVARQQQETVEAGPVWSYWHGYIRACERILEDITDIGCREHEKSVKA